MWSNCCIDKFTVEEGGEVAGEGGVEDGGEVGERVQGGVVEGGGRGGRGEAGGTDEDRGRGGVGRVGVVRVGLVVRGAERWGWVRLLELHGNSN